MKIYLNINEDTMFVIPDSYKMYVVQIE